MTTAGGATAGDGAAAVEGERVAVGKVSLLVPRAWQAQAAEGERRAFVVPGPAGGQAGVVSLQRVGPLPKAGPPLAARLEAAALGFGKAVGITRVGPAQTAVLGTVPALVAPLAPAGLAAGLLVDGEVVLLLALWASEAAFKQVNAVLATGRPVLPPAPVPPLGEARRAAVVGAELPAPAAWEAGPPCAAPNRVAFRVPRALLACPAVPRYGVVVEVQPEPVLSLREAAMRFVREAAAAFGRELEPDPKRVRVVGASELGLPDGTLVATVIVEEQDGGRLHTRVVAHARATAKATYLGAVVAGPWSEGWPKDAPAERVWEKVDDVAEGLLAVLAQARALPLPALDPAAAARLVARGRFVHRRAWDSASSLPSIQGYGTFSAYSSGFEEEVWTFAADGAFTVTRRRDSVLNTYDSFTTTTGEPVSYSPVLGLWERADARKGRYEVRAAAAPGDDALLVLRDDGDGVTLHALRFEAEGGEYGSSKPRGLAIDGRVEGTYESSSGSLGTFHVWSAPGPPPAPPG